MKQVLLYGPPLAGKATILRELADRLLASLEPYVVPFDDEHHVQDRGLCVTRESPAATIVTISGAVWNTGAWRAMIRAADVLLLVLDSQKSRWSANRECILAVCQTAHPARVALVFTKTDLASPSACEHAINDLLPLSAAHWPRFTTSVVQSESLYAPLLWALQ